MDAHCCSIQAYFSLTADSFKKQKTKNNLDWNMAEEMTTFRQPCLAKLGDDHVLPETDMTPSKIKPD